MPSPALLQWQQVGLRALDEIADAHRAVGGHGRGRRYATLQINHAYTVMVSSQFQGFCRALHTACVDVVANATQPPLVADVLRATLVDGRKLDFGNPNPGHIGSDFNRFGMRFWDAVYAASPRNRGRRVRLDELNACRNAIAHQDFSPTRVDGRLIDFGAGSGALQLGTVRSWRAACAGLAVEFDDVMGAQLGRLVGARPW